MKNDVFRNSINFLNILSFEFNALRNLRYSNEILFHLFFLISDFYTYDNTISNMNENHIWFFNFENNSGFYIFM